MEYLDPEVVVTQLTRLGFVVREPGLLGAALARPETRLFGADVYPEIETKIAALMDSLVNSHPLIDGNKRSSWLIGNLFAELNGFEIVASTEDAFSFILSIAAGSGDVAGIALWLRHHLVPVSSPQNPEL